MTLIVTLSILGLGFGLKGQRFLNMIKFVERILQKRLSEDIGCRPEEVSAYRVAKAFHLFLLTVRHRLSDTLLIGSGVVIAGLGLKSFLLPNHFIDGGVTGISLLVTEISGASLSALIVVLNIPFLLLAYRQISPAFAFKSILAVSALAVAIAVIPYPLITTDKLLIATFGGFFLGGGIGLTIRGGAVLDGTEVLAIFLSRRSSLSVGDIILVFNLMIFSVAAYLLGFEIAMYAVLTYLAASKTVDFIIEGVEEYIGVTIISSHHGEICKFVIEELRVGVTSYAGNRGFGKRGPVDGLEIIYTVITRLEMGRLQQGVEKIDPNAFLVMSNVRGIKGGSIRKRAVDKH